LHSIEKKEEEEPNVFAQGMQGWKMLFNTLRRKKPQEEQNSQPSMENANI
jgi:hypothetical protein